MSCSLESSSSLVHIHTSQAVLHSLKEVPGLKDFQQWLGEEIQREAQRGKHEVTNMSLNFSGVGSHARLFKALAAMLSRNALNPADTSILYKHYAEEESPPPAHYLYYVPQLLGRCKCIDPLPNHYHSALLGRSSHNFCAFLCFYHYLICIS
jgi:hypothetical protein